MKQLKMIAADARRPTPLRWFVTLVTVAVLVVVVPVHQVRACAFDMVKPERTAIDWVVEADHLLLARPKPENPFAYGMVEVLYGDTTEIDIPHLVDRTARHRLSAAPQDAVLFARFDDGDWRRVAYVDSEFRRVLDISLAHRDEWQSGFHESRLRLIDSLQDIDHRTLRFLLISELDKVPYNHLRTLDLRIPAGQLLSELWQPANYPFQAIHVLLLGLSDDAAARAEIYNFVDRAKDQMSPTNLGAFSAALIELEGAAAVQKLSEDILFDPNQPLDKVEQVVMALSVQHAVTDAQTQQAIADTLSDLVEKRPETGVLIARQFTLRSDWSQAILLEPLIRERKLTTIKDLASVTAYVLRAKQTTAQSEDG